MTIELIADLSGYNAEKALKIFKDQGSDATINYMKQWHTPGSHETLPESMYDERDQDVFFQGKYLLLVSQDRHRVALEYIESQVGDDDILRLVKPGTPIDNVHAVERSEDPVLNEQQRAIVKDLHKLFHRVSGVNRSRKTHASLNCNINSFMKIAFTFGDNLPSMMLNAHKAIDVNEWDQSELLMSAENGLDGYYWKHGQRKVIL